MVDEEICFKSWSKSEECLFKVYAGFECILQECQEGDGKTQKVQKHIPCSVAWVLISDHPDVDNRRFLYRPSPDEDTTLECCDDVIDHLMESLQELEEEVFPYQKQVKPLVLINRGGRSSLPSSHTLLYVR